MRRRGSSTTAEVEELTETIGRRLMATVTRAWETDDNSYLDSDLASLCEAFFVHLGNADARRGGLDIRPRQTRTTGEPISWLGVSDSPFALGLVAHGRTPMGREEVRMEWQVAEAGVPLENRPVGNSGWTDAGTPGNELGSAARIETEISGLSPDTRYHWRVRTRSRSLYTPLTMWATLAPAGASMTAL